MYPSKEVIGDAIMRSVAATIALPPFETIPTELMDDILVTVL